MTSIFEYLGFRRMPINYISPAVCEDQFSSTSDPTIVLEPWTPKRSPSGLFVESISGGVRLTWDVYPGALCYSVYRAVDELDPFGEYVLVAECVEDTDIIILGDESGTFRITVITEEGESDFTEPVVAVQVACSQGGAPLPDEFLEPDEATLVSIASDGTSGFSSTTNVTTPGRHQIVFQSGTVAANCGIFEEEFVPSVYLRDAGDADITIFDPLDSALRTTTINYGCSWLVALPQPCSPEADLFAVRPEGIMGQLDLIPTTVGAGYTVKVFANGSPNGVICGGTGTANFVFKRTHKFMAQPALLTVLNIAGLECDDDGGGAQWNGTVAGPTFYSSVTCAYALFDPGYIGQSYIGASVNITGSGGGSWIMTIGSLWTGVKTYGNTPVGNYARTSSCNPSAPSCLVVVGA